MQINVLSFTQLTVLSKHAQNTLSVELHFKHLFTSLHVAGESSTVTSGESRGKVIQAYAELQTKMWHRISIASTSCATNINRDQGKPMNM